MAVPSNAGIGGKSKVETMPRVVLSVWWSLIIAQLRNLSRLRCSFAYRTRAYHLIDLL